MSRRNKIIGIYKIENQINKKIYIGSSLDIKGRWSSHKSHLRNEIHVNKHLQRSWNKYGENNFKFLIIEEIGKNELREREEYWIKIFNSANVKFGYNASEDAVCSTRGVKLSEDHKDKLRKSWATKDEYSLKQHRERLRLANTGHHVSKETRDKISKANTGKKRTKEVRERISQTLTGRKHTEESKKKMSKMKKGIPRSAETIKKMSESQKGEKSAWYGKKHSKETIQKMSKAQRGENNPNSKLKNEEVETIKEMLSHNCSIKDITTKFKIGRSTVYRIKNNERITY